MKTETVVVAGAAEHLVAIVSSCVVWVLRTVEEAVRVLHGRLHQHRRLHVPASTHQTVPLATTDTDLLWVAAVREVPLTLVDRVVVEKTWLWLVVPTVPLACREEAAADPDEPANRAAMT